MVPVLGPVGELEGPVAPGLSLVPVQEPELAARALALRVGAPRVLNPAEVDAAIARRHHPVTGLRAARQRERAARARLLTARIVAAQAADAVPAALVAADPAEVLATARDALHSEEDVAAAVRMVGPRPLLDDDLEAAALVAGAALDDANDRIRSARTNAQPTIAVGNVAGAVLVASVFASVIFGWIGPTSFTAGALLAIAVACPITAAAVAAGRFVDAKHRLTVAAGNLDTALAAARFASLDELACQREALDAWEERRKAAADAVAAADEVVTRWLALGAGVDPRDATAAVARAEHARATREADELARLEHQLTLRALVETERRADQPLVVCDPAGELDRLLGLSTAVPVVLVTTDRCALTWPSQPVKRSLLSSLSKRRRRRGG